MKNIVSTIRNMWRAFRAPASSSRPDTRLADTARDMRYVDRTSEDRLLEGDGPENYRRSFEQD